MIIYLVENECYQLQGTVRPLLIGLLLFKIQVLFDSLHGRNTIVKLRAQAFQFARVIIQQVRGSKPGEIFSIYKNFNGT